MPLVRRCAAVAMLLAAHAFAQFEYGEVLGTVRDTSGGVIQGAKVKIRSVDTNIERSIQTNDEGIFSFPGLRIGAYQVSVEQEGFKTAQASVPELRVGDRLRLDITMETGQLAERISVEAAATQLLEADTSSRGQVIGLNQIRELPLNKRDYTQLVLLAPGTAVNPRQRIGGAININGNRALQNNYLLDGVDNNSNATSFRGERVDVVRPSVDAVAEFKVQTNS